MNLSGRGDKDMGTAIEWFGLGETRPDDAGGSAGMSTTHGLRGGEGGGSRRARRLPAGRLPGPGRLDRGDARDGRAAGCDVIEVGLPYSDPVMDGPTIQAAAQQALEAGFRTADVLRTVEAVAATGAPTVVMTYWNPVERYGVERFAKDLANAGGAGLITPDLVPDEAGDWIGAADEHGLDKVFLVAPSSTDERLAMTTAACRGFVYATAVMGVTGARDDLQRPRRAARRAHPHRDRRCPSASGSASPTATRPPRWRASPTASSSGPRSCAGCSTRAPTVPPGSPPSRT